MMKKGLKWINRFNTTVWQNKYKNGTILKKPRVYWNSYKINNNQPLETRLQNQLKESVKQIKGKSEIDNTRENKI